MRKLRVLVVDDSAFMRLILAKLIEQDGRFEVVGQAKDGAEAVELAAQLEPDVISMDYNMPRLNGAEATRRILARRPLGVVMLSAHTQAGAAETLEALSAGAVDFVPKPRGEVSADLSEVRAQFLDKLYAAAQVNPSLIAAQPSLSKISAGAPASSLPSSAGRVDQACFSPAAQGGLAPRPSFERNTTGNYYHVIVIACSTGGPAALAELVPRLDLSHAALVVVQHMPQGFTRALAEQLSQRAAFSIREAYSGMRLGPGVAALAPGDSHLSMDRSGILSLNQGPLLHGVRPAADITFKAAASSFGARVVGVVLTGMGRDGAAGLLAIRSAGGRTIAQDSSSSLVYGMPKAARELGAAEQVLPLPHVAPAICRLVSPA